MSMRKQLEDEISTMLMKYISSEALEETRMNLTMILDKYREYGLIISKAE